MSVCISVCAIRRIVDCFPTHLANKTRPALHLQEMLRLGTQSRPELIALVMCFAVTREGSPDFPMDTRYKTGCPHSPMSWCRAHRRCYLRLYSRVPLGLVYGSKKSSPACSIISNASGLNSSYDQNGRHHQQPSRREGGCHDG